MLFTCMTLLGASRPVGARVASAAGVCGANPSPPDPADPAMILSKPVAGDSVQSPLVVQGLARVFEGAVSLALKDATGADLATGGVQAAEGAPTLAPFSGSLSFAVSQPSPACLWVYEASARDGSPINVVQAPLTLLPGAARAVATYAAGWNLVAGPAGTRFSQALGPLYTLRAGDIGYRAESAAAPAAGGVGYWAYFATATTVSLVDSGTQAASLTAPAGRWLMIGNPSATATAQIRGADVVLRYDAASANYVAVGSLAPGQGAWAISLSGGTIAIGP
ncbi:MAG TPA: Gmad2 immunoglobulin-like domain-containing protein [Dehalococcoidia bacterium]|nr:Gmad2 immunoglobulin-like domain-containing protein [Dehalococcoidia bacterium]